jgi:hypothetical protein
MNDQFRILIRPENVPLKIWNKFIQELNQDFASCHEFESDANFQIQASEQTKSALSKVFMAIACQEDNSVSCQKCGQHRIISGEDWSECLSCGKREVSSDPETYYDSPLGYEADCNRWASVAYAEEIINNYGD